MPKKVAIPKAGKKELNLQLEDIKKEMDKPRFTASAFKALDLRRTGS